MVWAGNPVSGVRIVAVNQDIVAGCLSGGKEFVSGDVLAGDLQHIAAYHLFIMLPGSALPAAVCIRRGGAVAIYDDLPYELLSVRGLHLAPKFFHCHCCGF